MTEGPAACPLISKGAKAGNGRRLCPSGRPDKPGREDIVDLSRIEEVIGKVRGYAQEQGLEPNLVDVVYRLMIERFIAQEASEFERLRDARQRSDLDE